jgi:hypothetical protein
LNLVESCLKVAAADFYQLIIILLDDVDLGCCLFPNHASVQDELNRASAIFEQQGTAASRE